MATVGPALKIPFTVSATTAIVGQGNLPIFRARYSTDDVSDATPNWTNVDERDLRAFNVSRGRESELSEHDAGTGSVLLDNRDRNFDPNFNAAIRPMNRWWLYEEFSGEVHDLIKGYAESYDNTWPDWGGSDAECLVSIVDEFKVLVLDGLPTTDPPRANFEELIASDNPVGVWRFNQDVVATQIQQPSIVEPDVPPPTTDDDSPAPVPQVYNPFQRTAFYRPRNPLRKAYPKK